jgi:hypothetical protein
MRRVVAASMTMGGHGTVESLLDLLAAAGVQTLPDPADYDRSRQRFLEGKKDADNDGLTNADQWEHVDGLAWNDRLAAFAMDATNGTREDGGAGSSTGGGAGLPGCDTPACLPTREVQRAEALLGIGGTAEGPIGSASERLPFGTPLTVSAEPDVDYSFIMWFAPGSLIDGSRELQEAGFPLPPGDTPFAPKAVFGQNWVPPLCRGLLTATRTRLAGLLPVIPAPERESSKTRAYPPLLHDHASGGPKGQRHESPGQAKRRPGYTPPHCRKR